MVMQEPSETTTRPTVPPQQHDPKDKGKAIMDADYELAARIQAQEHEELTIEEKSKLFVELIDKRKKHFSRLRAEEQRRKPLTKAQKRNQMCTYLKNMADTTYNQLRTKSFDRSSEALTRHKKNAKNFDREDLEVLWRIVKTIFKKIKPVDEVWKRQQGLVKVLNWKLFYSCGVHCVTIQSIMFYLLVEKMYPLTNHTLHQMFNNVKLKVDYEYEMAFHLLRLDKKQLKEGYIPE
ncbi:hypothetical protein Tco_1092635 [Tanacetum coccineum]|uniref:Uncharacterized protein n=1 Tax=Tanacetum coccineum TaxID=301880 RepID=A0ABQ5ICU8_9ASTR